MSIYLLFVMLIILSGKNKKTKNVQENYQVSSAARIIQNKSNINFTELKSPCFCIYC